MKKELSHTNTESRPLYKARGVSLIEVIVSAALVLTLASVFTNAVLFGQEGSVTGGTRTRAILYAEEGLEAVRSIRNEDFARIVDGTYGIVKSNGSWAFVVANDQKDIFTRRVTVSPINAVTKQITSSVTWARRDGSIASTTLTTYATNLGLVTSQVKDLEVDISGGHMSSGNKLVGIKIKNIGKTSITLSGLILSWSNTLTSKLEEIRISGGTVWSQSGPGSPSGLQSSGSKITITDVVMQPNSNTTINEFRFTQNMTNNAFSITFIMSDNSSTTATTTVLN